jgi:uncharacterized Zn finger protein
MDITPHDPPLRFLVSSAKGMDKKYLVDLGEFGGNGRCDCPHFRCVLQQELALEPDKNHRCKHIVATLLHLSSLVVEQFIRDEEMRKKSNIQF